MSKPPKVFISYSWTNQQHQDRVREWAERLITDNVQVVMDIFDLKEGDNKYAFMERMVADESVTQVLMFCDHRYAEKADKQKDTSGVGTESQIISSEIYSHVAQSKFIPIFCEFTPDGDPYVPVFLKSRIGIDFSTFEKVNENWEKLIRLLYGKPLYIKPALGKTPSYITANTSVPLSPVVGKFETLKSALLSDKKGISLYRDDFLDACFSEADKSRVRQEPDMNLFPFQILETCGQLKSVRNALIDWVMLEGKVCSEQPFAEELIAVLERLSELKCRPPEVHSWSDDWFTAHGLFTYETFLYLVAALLKLKLYSALHEIFTTHYLCPATARHYSSEFETFSCFWAPATDMLQAPLKPQPNHKFTSTVGEIVRRQADRTDIPYSNLLEAELLIMLMALIAPNSEYGYWYPHTSHYDAYGEKSEFFVRASQHKYFKNLTAITGIKTADELRAIAKPSFDKYCQQWQGFSIRGLWNKWNMDKLDSIK